MKLPTLPALRAMPQPERLRCFVTWLGEQPPETPYDYNDIGGCALCLFGCAVSGYPKRIPGLMQDYPFVRAGGTFTQPVDRENDDMVYVVPASAKSLLRASATLGSLHRRLLPLVPPTEAELERVELRALGGEKREVLS